MSSETDIQIEKADRLAPESPVETDQPPARKNSRKIIIAAVLMGIFALCQAALSYSATASRSAFVVPIVLIGISIAYMVWLEQAKSESKEHVERLWLVAAVVLGLGYCVVLPLNSVPDEAYHYMHTYAYSDIFLGTEWDHDYMYMRHCDRALLNRELRDVSIHLFDYKRMMSEDSLFASESDAELVRFDSERGLGFERNWAQVRAPAALGITVARLVGLNGYATYILGKIFALAYFVALVFFAIRITPVGKNVFMASSLLPMTLDLAASYSYDSGTIALCYLLFAFCLRAIYGKGPLTKQTWIGIMVLTFLIVPTKVVYAPIVLCALIIPSSRFASKRQAVILKVAFVAVLLGTFMLTELNTVSSMGGTAAPFEETTTMTMSYLLSNPVKTAMLFLRTIATYASTWLFCMVTGPLGSFQASIGVPAILSVAFIVMLVFSCLPTESDSIMPSWLHRIVFIGVFAIAILGSLLSMALGWTAIGSPIIDGVQGRYFLPVLPPLLYSLRVRSVNVRGSGSETLLASMFFLNAIYVGCVYAGVLLS